MSDFSIQKKYGSCIPRKLADRLSMKEKEAKKGKDAPNNRASGPDYHELYFVKEDDGTVYGIEEDCRYRVSEYTMYGVPEDGDTWRCLLDFSFNPATCIPVEKLSETAVTEDENESASASEAECSETQVCESEECAVLKRELKDLKEGYSAAMSENAKFKEKCREVERLTREKTGLEGQLKDSEKKVKVLESNNLQLRQQISANDRANKSSNIEYLKTKIQTLEGDNTALRFENERLSAFIEANGIDTENITNKNSVFAMMTSPSVMHSVAFADGRYTVQFGRGFTMIRLIPDEGGAVECRNGNIDLPALGRFSKFSTLVKLKTCIEDGVVTVEA